MAAFWRDLGRIISKISNNGRAERVPPLYERLKKRGRSGAQAARTVRNLIEALEDRRMLSVIPGPIVNSRFDLVGPSGPPAPYDSNSTPSIAYDPADPNKMVAVWVSDEPYWIQPDQHVYIEGAYSTNAGRTWARLGVPGNTFDPTVDGPPPKIYDQATEPSIAIDRDHNVYLTYREHNVEDSAGRIVLQKYSFAGGNPVLQTKPFNDASRTQGAYAELYSWYNVVSAPYTAAYWPTVAVDANVPSYIDPADPTQTLVDEHVGNVYVAWSTFDLPPSYPLIPNDWNAYAIKFTTSSDGAATFGPRQFINENGAGNSYNASRAAIGMPDQNARPQIIVSQGTLDGRVAPGRVTVVWDNWYPGLPNNLDRLVADGFNGVNTSSYYHPGGGIKDAIDGAYVGTDIKPSPTGQQPQTVILGNFDGLPGIDIFTVNRGSNDVTVLSNDGNNTFPDGVDPTKLLPPTTVGPTPTWAVSGNFDTAAGGNEIAVLCSGNKEVQILESTGTGSFNIVGGIAGNHSRTGTNPVYAIAGNFDNAIDPNSYVDLIVVSQGNPTGDIGEVRFLPGKGDGTFGAAFNVPLSGGQNPTSVASGYFDNDAFLDLAITLQRGAGYYVDVLLGDGTGSFTLIESYAVGNNPVQVRSASMNPATDAFADLVVLNNGSSNVSVLLGNGDGTFQDARTFGLVGTQPRNMLLLDIDGDQAPDAVVTKDDGTVSMLFNGGGGQLFDSLRIGAGTNPVGVASLGDLNTDGMPELVVANSGSNNVYVMTSSTSSTGVIPRTTPFEFKVDVSDPYFRLGDLDVDLSMLVPDLNDIRVRLIAPNGTAVTLFENQVDALGQQRGIPPLGLTGAELGYHRGVMPTVFDSEANIGIKSLGAAAPWVGHYYPESGKFSLRGAFYNGANAYTAAQMTGIWTLEVTDYQKEDLTPPQTREVVSAALHFQGRTVWMGNRVVATTGVRGGTNSTTPHANDPYPNAGAAMNPSPGRGIGPSFSLASDNTLGAFSPYQGRLYLAYTGHGGGPADNTDIELVYTDDAFQTGTLDYGPVLNTKTFRFGVNDDLGSADGFSESNRAQFQPTVAVDQSSGTLVLAFYDARHDGSRTRVSTYIATSITGGDSATFLEPAFGPQVFANAPWMAKDAITLEDKILGPVPDNQGALNGETDPLFGFGEHQGMIAVNGHVIPVWAGNRNGARLGILAADLSIASGPRVVSSTMGPVSLPGDTVNPALPGGSPQVSAFEVVFDRPIDPTTFTPSDITVIYRDTQTPGNQPGLNIAVKSVVAQPMTFTGAAGFPPNTNPNLGATTFLVTFVTPQTATGTYSYFINPNVNDRIRQAVPTVGGPRWYSVSGVKGSIRIPSVGTGGETIPLKLANNLATSTITVAGAGAAEMITDLNVQVWLAHPALGDLILTLISPSGKQVVLTSLNGGMGDDYDRTIFDDQATILISDPAAQAPFSGSFKPQDPLGLAQVIGRDPGTGAIQPLNGNWQLKIEDTRKGNTGVLYRWTMQVQTAAVYPARPAQLNKAIPAVGTGGSGTANDITTSTITIAGVANNNLIEEVNVNVTLTHPNDGDLILTLIAPDGKTRIPLATRRGAGAADYTNTTFDDSAAVAIGDPAAVAPFTGSFKPDSALWALSALNGMHVNGTWTLEINDMAAGNVGTLLSWSMEIRTGIGNVADQNANAIEEEPAVAGVSLGDVWAAPAPTQPTAYTTTNGSYFVPPYSQDTLPLIVPGPHIIDTHVSALYVAPEKQRGLAIPAVGTGGTGDLTKDRMISQFTVSANPNTRINDLNVYLSLSHSQVSDLKITLIGPDGTQVVLADHLGGAGQNYMQTAFDDGAAASITTGAAPFTGWFKPQQALSGFSGTLLNGQWTLQVEDTVGGDSGVLIGWMLDAQTTNTTTGENLILDNTINSMDVTFDRDMSAATFTPLAVLRMMGPLGQLKGPFTVTANPLGTDPDPNYPRTYRIGFPVQELSGTYAVTLASTIASKPTAQAPAGEQLDTNLNAGVAMLRGEVPMVTADPVRTPVVFPSANVPLEIGSLTTPGTVVESQIVIPSDQGFPIQYAQVQLDITYANDPDLEAVLIAPDGAIISLFWGVGTGINTADFDQTSFVDELNVTPIANGAAPFRGTFSPRPNPLLPQPLTLNYLYSPSDPTKRKNSAGIWRLQVKSNAAGMTGMLNSWSLTFDKPLPSTGLGEHVSDQASVSARIFTQDPTNPLSHNVWTSVGPASNNDGQNSGRISGLAIDPSDPSGNTVYVGGASGGIWKTTNFMTSNVLGPTWVPLTDFGPVFSMNIGSIAIFGRNNDPNQSVLFAGTGEGDTGTTGVGFLRSMDAGVSWELLDSTVNFDASGKLMPIDSPLRDHLFVGTTIWKVAVDPRFTPAGDMIIYAAVRDPVAPAAGATTRGGIWRSLDSGRTWQQMRAGANACDVLLDQNSGYFDQYGKPTGNLQVVYAAFEGDGIYKSPNRGQVWNLMDGNVGDPLLIDRYAYPGYPPIAVNHPAYFNPDYVGFNGLEAPNGANIERIVMAKPAITNDPVKDLLYQGWLYAAAVSNVTYTPLNAIVHFANVYITKDYGENWTRIRLPIGSNDTRNADYNFGGNVTLSGYVLSNYNLSIAVDPNDANVVYVGGVGPGFVRVNITNLSDAHSLFRNTDRTDGGTTGDGQPDPLVQNPSPPGANPAYSALSNPITYLRPVVEPSTGARVMGGFISLISNPFRPFESNSTVLVGDTYQFANSGAGARNTIFGAGLSAETYYQHRVITMIDPLTGRSRLFFGDDTGIKTGVDYGDGTVTLGIGTAATATGDRNGNLGITQFFYGAAQPSNLAAQAALSMFYGNTYHNGYVTATPDMLTTGDINWTNDSSVAIASDGSGGGVATDQQGSGTVYTFRWPEGVYPPSGFAPPNNPSDFFTVRPNGTHDYIGRTSGLLQTTTGNPLTYDPQWPSTYTPLTTGSNFAVNPVSKDQILVSSVAGRIFGTENQGKKWVAIGDPTALDGTYAPALAYGAPDPKGPGGPDTTNFFLYAGTTGGKIFVTFRGGGANGNAWIDLSAGLDGSPVKQIVTNPMRGSHEAFAVTDAGVFHMADSTAANPIWVNITGNVFFLEHDSFNISKDTTKPSMIETTSRQLTSIQADWRYVIPDNMSNPNGPTHPVLYVSSYSGVYRSLDKGLNWNHFPDDVVDGSPSAGGYLPSVQVTDLDITLGNVNPTTGREDGTTGISTLLASTFGRGAFAIRLAPVVATATLQMSSATDTGTSNTDQVTKISTPTFTGLSQQSAFGNHVRITLLNMTDPNYPVVIGGFSGTFNDASDVQANWTDEFGRFSVSVYPGVLVEGTYTIGVRATDDAGTVGGIAILARPVTYDKTPPSPVIGRPAKAISATEGIPYTGVVAEFADTSSQCMATINWGDGTTSAGAISPNVGGWYDVTGTHIYTDPGSYTLSITITDPAGNDSTAIPASATVDNPAIVPAGGLTYTVNEGDNFAAQPVATFIDPGGAESLDNYSATIDWGDGTTSAGVITYDAVTGIFTVSGGHFFPDSGTKTIVTSIGHDMLAVVTATSAMTVQNVAPTPSFSGPQFAFSTFPTTFTIGATDMSPADQAAGFTYTINWGDGTAVETIAVAVSNGVAHTITHTFAIPGTYQAFLSAMDKDGGIAATSFITVLVTEPTSLQNVVINNSERQRSIMKTISFRPTYNGALLAKFSTKNLKLMYNGSTVVSTKGMKVTYKKGVATVYLSAMSLADGDYQLQVALGGNIVRPVDFHKLLGDCDGDRVVGKSDWYLVKRSQGYRAGQTGYNVDADLNGDGVINTIDMKTAKYMYGRTMAPYRMKALMYPTKKPVFPKVDFKTVAANGNVKIVELSFYNLGTGTMKLRGLRLAGGSGAFSFGVPGSLWAPTTGEFIIAANSNRNVRIYLTTNTPQVASNQLLFDYSLNGKKFAKGSVTLKANIV
ncbi:MAG: proprotein convertase P-domain-containing protein [Planctomycetota bacterium]|nr:proprotein convertase P-domain-containing protein [Planctomycetota bacterium]